MLESQLIYRLGSPSSEKVDVRLICASNRDLVNLVAQGQFREDLHYRITTVPICLPPLHARKEDIPLLAVYFCLRNLPLSSRRVNIISAEALERLCSYDWPGNVRQLAHATGAALVLGEGPVIGPDEFDLPEQPAPQDIHSAHVAAAKQTPPMRRDNWIEKVASLLLEHPLIRTTELADLLRCSQRTVQRAIRQLVAQNHVTQERDRNDPRILRYRRNGRQD